MLESPTLAVDGIVAKRVDAVEGLSHLVDDPRPARQRVAPYEQPIVGELIDGPPPGVALYAVSGTGRYGAYLATRGREHALMPQLAHAVTVARR